MKVLIIGATGQVGGHTVDHALKAGHKVTAFGRSADKLEARDNFDPVAGDVLNPADIGSAMQDQDAVILTFGAPLNKETLTSVPSITTDGTRHVLDAMRDHNVTRLVCMTAIGAGDSEGHGRFVFRNIIEPVLLGRIMQDRTNQEELVRTSPPPEWVIVRPTELSNADAGAVRIITDLEKEKEPTTIPRKDVGRILVELIVDKKYDGQTILITADD